MTGRMMRLPRIGKLKLDPGFRHRAARIQIASRTKVQNSKPCATCYIPAHENFQIDAVPGAFLRADSCCGGLGDGGTAPWGGAGTGISAAGYCAADAISTGFDDFAGPTDVSRNCDYWRGLEGTHGRDLAERQGSDGIGDQGDR